jgi:cyclopropane-fatty-acyl-phospholipid synthase
MHTSPSTSNAPVTAMDTPQLPPAQGGIGGLLRPLHRLLSRLLRHLQFGSLLVTLPDGRRMEAKGASPGPAASITLHSWRPVGQMLLHGDIGLAQSFRDGDWFTPDLTALLELGLRNEAAWGAALQASTPARWFHRLAHLLRSNTRKGSRQNIAFHYDLGNDFYTQWLDASMLYSSGLYAQCDDSLEQAQARKLDRILALLDAPAHSKVLEIGCGWGALATALGHAAPQGRVTGLTLSTEQLQHARERIARAGLQDRVDVQLQDYRDVQGDFDRIVSVEMLEAVGERYWPTYFDTLRQRLKPGGIAVVQVITIAEDYFDRYRSEPDFIQRFIFPGGMLPTVRALNEQATRAGLTLRTAETFGPSYALTLADWRKRFLAAWPGIEPLGFDDAFRRLWTYYLSYCEAGFRTGRVNVGLHVLQHAQNGAIGGEGTRCHAAAKK